MPEQAPDPIEPGWNNGVAELLDPVELGWRLLKRTVESELDDPEDETTTGGWNHV